MLEKKLFYSAQGSLIFLLISILTKEVHGNRPRWINVPYFILFTIVSLLIMLVSSRLTGKGLNLGLSLKYSWYSGLIYFLIASSAMYVVTDKLLPLELVNRDGPTYLGIAIHSLVYMATLVGVMYFPKDM